MSNCAALPRRASNDDGNVVLEFAFVAPVLLVLLINVADFSTLIWAQMEVEYSAQMGAQAAYKNCSTGALPAKTNCTNLSTAVTTAVHSTSLGSAVTLASGYPTETYYCVSGTNLQSVGNYSAPPSPFDCSAAGDPGTKPGDYIEVNVDYAYSPIFVGLSLAAARTVRANSIQRLN
jgi:Flp pilus assembly protein TadG